MRRFRLRSSPRRSCRQTTAIGTPVTGGAAVPTGGGGVCSTALVLIEQGVDQGHAVPLSDSSGTITCQAGDRVRVAHGPVDPSTGRAVLGTCSFVRVAGSLGATDAETFHRSDNMKTGSGP
jgi:hypothetical protein